MMRRQIHTMILTTLAAMLSSSTTLTEAFAPHYHHNHPAAHHESGLEQSNLINGPRGKLSSPPPSSSNPDDVSFDQLQLLEAVYKIEVSPRLKLPPLPKPTPAKAIATNLQHRRVKMHRPVSQYSRVEPGRTHEHHSYRSDSESGSPGLTREEEIQYSFQLRTFRAAVRLRDSLVRQRSGMYVHPTEEEWAQACGTTVFDLRRVMHEGREARTALVAANIGLVTSQAKKFYHATKQSMQSAGGVGTILTLQDLIQEGNLGLMEAAERYQPEKGFRFSTYATWWVRQRISKSVTESSRTIRLPSHVHTMLQKVRRARTEIKASSGKEPSLQDLSQYLEIPVDKLMHYTKSSQNVVSLESQLRTTSFKDDSRTIGDTIASDGPTPFEDAEADHLRRDIRAVMESTLLDKERDVIILRFGLDNNKPRTVAETAAQLGISTDRVRLVEARALNKLRHPQRNHVLKEYITSSSSKNSDADKPTEGRKTSKKNPSTKVAIVQPRTNPQNQFVIFESQIDTMDSSSSQQQVWLF